MSQSGLPPSGPDLLGLATGPETLLIGALLEGARGGRSGDATIEARVGGVTDGLILRGPGDDASTFRVPSGTVAVVSSDASVEGIHFRRAWMTWETIGYRAAAAALSDLAAMAASVIGLTVSVALPPELDAGTASALGRGIGQALARTGGDILGGDLVASPGPVMLDVTVLGYAADPIGRDGASPGDEVWVTGSLGGAAAAVADLVAGLEPIPEARAAFERPRPRIEEALWLAEHAEVRAMIDLSDGLARDARHLAVASGVGVTVRFGDLPAHVSLDPYLGSDAGRRLLLAGGEDYELLLALAPQLPSSLRLEFESRFDTSLTRIWAVHEGVGLRVTGAPGSASPAEDGYDHFG